MGRALKSLQNQTYENIEIIVVDDSPNDYAGRQDIIDRMAEICRQDCHVKYLINEKNLGGSLARNRGIATATGEYITFLDDDDEYLPQKVENQLRFMQTGEYDLTLSDMIMYDDNGKVVDVREHRNIPSFENDTLLKYHLMRHLTGTPTFMFKSQKLKEIGGFEDAIMGQEFYLMLKSIEHGLKIAYMPKCDVRIYKDAAESISQGRNKINGENKLYQFKQKYFSILNDEEIRFIKFRHWAVMAVAYKRNKDYGSMVGALAKALCVSPKLLVSEGFKFLKKIYIHR